MLHILLDLENFKVLEIFLQQDNLTLCCVVKCAIKSIWYNILLSFLLFTCFCTILSLFLLHFTVFFLIALVLAIEVIQASKNLLVYICKFLYTWKEVIAYRLLKCYFNLKHWNVSKVRRNLHNQALYKTLVSKGLLNCFIRIKVKVAHVAKVKVAHVVKVKGQSLLEVQVCSKCNVSFTLWKIYTR